MTEVTHSAERDARIVRDWATELTMDWGADGTFPFVEDENGNITGYGHYDKAEFAAEINRYDAACNGDPFPEDEQWTAQHITHQWAVPTYNEYGEWLLLRAHPGPNSIPVTTLWGQR